MLLFYYNYSSRDNNVSQASKPSMQKILSTLKENMCIHASNIKKHPLYTWICVTHLAWKNP